MNPQQSGNQAKKNLEQDDWLPDEDIEMVLTDSVIYQKGSINPAKRRRLEAMREERELMQNINDTFDFDEYD